LQAYDVSQVSNAYLRFMGCDIPERQNILIQLNGQQSPYPGNITVKINVFCKAKTVYERCFFE